MIINSRSLLIIISLELLVFCGSNLFAQAKPANSLPKIWFVARVINTDPFTIEYLDDWYRHQPHRGNQDYQIGVTTNPQAESENVKKFKIGDIIKGEICISYGIRDCPISRVPDQNQLKLKLVNPEFEPPLLEPELSLPPSIAINLKKLGEGYKIRYQRKGFLLSYKPRSTNIVTSLNIFRDGTTDLASYDAGWIRRSLSQDELAAIERAFFASQADKIETSKTNEYFKLQLSTVFGRYRNLLIDESSKESNKFISLLDNLIKKQVRDATYRINYMWRYSIKDWQFGDILPLDEAVDTHPKYLMQHWKRLSETKASTEFFEEAKDRYGYGMNLTFYRYKGRLYSFEFPICTDRPTGSWACFRLNEVGKPLADGRVWMNFEEWPKDLRIKLEDIPRDGLIDNSNRFGKGLDVPKSDLEKHSEFFVRFLHERPSYREGDYIYYGLKVWFH